MIKFVPGQRWFSTAEPELGLGTVLRLAGRSVQIVFTGSGVVRQYALESAPMARAEFRVGDRIRANGEEFEIEHLDAVDGLLTYHSRGRRISEGELDAEQPVSQADARLLGGRVDRNDQFDFRLELLRRRAAAQQHPGAGVQSARIGLIPHQLRVAEIASERRPPRLLLADEVGLGKTIEACLIIAQQIASGRVGRTLVLVPESLVHQWFVELLRRFNLRFAIFDEERCEAIEAAQPGTNPFEDEQGIIAATTWLANDATRRTQLLAAGWDLLVVDEAHHLAWTPDGAGAEYTLVETLAARVPGVLLLTATPEQLGLGGHFARLRLLDPARYADLAAFEAETAGFVALSATVDALLDGGPLSPQDIATLAGQLGTEADTLPARLERIAAGHLAERDALVDALIDRHGTGRVMLRNRRIAVGGFPQRVKHVTRLQPSADDPTETGRLLAEFHADMGRPGHVEPEHDYARDPRMDWLLALIDRLAPQKLLLLCRSRAKVQALEDALRLRSGIAVARFHEDMNLLQRDRNAAYFAQEEDGARLLIASEIGAEGRNFQFAQHVVMWDLPPDPDMLEQRIGRLDRIGQRGDVHIHAAAIADSPQDVLLRWYDAGLDAFTQVCADGRELMHRFGEELFALAQDHAEPARELRFERLLADTRVAHAKLSALIAGGRDRLLELASRRGADQGLLRDALARDDRNAANDDFAWRLLEQFGVQHESLSPTIELLDPEYLTLDAFEELKSGPRQATTDRDTALARDDVLYLRDDHPLLLAAQDLLLSAETGNAAFLVDDTLPPRSVLLECVFVLECVAERRLHAARYLPPQPIRCTVDTRLVPRPDFVPGARALQRANDRPIDLVKYRKILAALVPPMLKRANQDAADEAQRAIDQALAHVDELLGHEIARLEALARVNPAVHPEEIVALRDERDALLAALPAARPRLDALRLVVSPDFLALRS